MNKVLDEIIDLMKSAGTRPMETGVPGLSMIKGDIPTHQLAALYKPMIGFTVQGTKILSIGERSTTMEGPSYYVLPLHVPATASVHPDSDGRPYMSLGLELNQKVLQSLLRDLPEDLIPTASEDFFPACEIDIEFMEAWLRLLRLTKTLRDIPALAPAYEREILYRVLMRPQGWYLRQLGLRESNFSRISQTVKWLRDNYTGAIDIGEMASKSGMAINTFHRQFKRATGLSPIQFQKQLRLLEARNLIAFEGYAVAGAAYQVGYQSPSQFNREYS
ncbi:AraC family transcriptional regulator [Desulfosporosinus shakirovi]|uniref:AraC family transcriptional regulator n=1 Tax=Desulfosporosinus shakirovi TaxID=2885154 RepID=UPI001E3DD7CB|nr:AraC family transcriptional regulator [Desulfosporosinus sp. SRJS8]MCB8815381.1 AraC family transcriptional regulator [Desulfosporosinus sp. SRJS8]